MTSAVSLQFCSAVILQYSDYQNLKYSRHLVACFCRDVLSLAVQLH